MRFRHACRSRTHCSVSARHYACGRATGAFITSPALNQQSARIAEAVGDCPSRSQRCRDCQASSGHIGIDRMVCFTARICSRGRCFSRRNSSHSGTSAVGGGIGRKDPGCCCRRQSHRGRDRRRIDVRPGGRRTKALLSAVRSIMADRSAGGSSFLSSLGSSPSWYPCLPDVCCLIASLPGCFWRLSPERFRYRYSFLGCTLSFKLRG